MGKLSILLGIMILTGGIIVGVSTNVSAEESLIPVWIKNNAGWWADGQIDDRSFVQGIQYLIKEKIMSIPSTQSSGTGSNEIPPWIKNNAKWWADDKISDTEFISALQYLVKEKILEIPLSEEQTKPELKTDTPLNTKSLRSSNANWVQLETTVQENDLVLHISLSKVSGQNSNYVVGDGIGKIKITNSKGEIVYSETIQVSEEDFGWYTRLLTGEEMLLAIKTVPLEEIKKSESPNGNISLEFATKDSEFEEVVIELFQLPAYSSEELSEIFENEYDKKSVMVNKKISQGDFEVTITRVGYFKYNHVFDNTTEEYFRVDMAIKNISNEKERTTLNALAILDNKNNQYDTQYGGTLDISKEIYPNVTEEVYVLFDKIPENTSSIRVVFDLGYRDDSESHYAPYSYEFDILLD